MKIAVLHQHVPDDALPDERDVLDEATCVARALESLGHTVEIWPCTLDLIALEKRLPSVDLFFNLVETLGGTGRLIHLVPGVLEARGATFTGNSSTALMLTGNKPLTKRVLAGAGVPVAPAFHAGRYIVKPAWEDASLGIDDEAVVDSLAEAEARVSSLGPGFFAEAYIPGREINVALIESPDGPQVLPIAEIVFDGDWSAKPRIVGYACKWEPDSFEYKNTRRIFPPDEGALFDRIRAIARDCWRALELEGYVRVDLRVTEDGQPFVLEINANPGIAPDSGFAGSLEAAGIRYEDAVARLVAGAMRRR